MFRLKIRNDETFLYSYATKDEISDRLAVVIQQESYAYSRRSHKNMISSECRQKISEWSYRIVDTFQIDREVVLTSCYFIDHFLSNEVQECKPALLRLISMSSLLLASKLNGSREITMKFMERLSPEISVSVLTKMEVLLLRSLKWHVHPPTAKTVVRLLLSLLAHRVDDTDVLQQVSKYAHHFAELSVFNAELVSVPLEEVAVASLLNAIEMIGKSDPSLIRKSFFDDCCSILRAQYATDDISFTQNKLWGVFLRNEECALVGESRTNTEPEAKRRRQERKICSPVSPMHIHP